jgi:branched-chain amino acid transport system permease protein
VHAVILQNIFNALQWGSFYSMIALGYCLVYGVLRLINFAHGDIFMTSAYIAFFIAATILKNRTLGPAVFSITLVLTMFATSLVGITIERIAYRPLLKKGASKLYIVITALMIGFVLENGNLAMFGARSMTFPSLIKEDILYFGAVALTTQKVMIITAAFVVFGILQFIVQKTMLGKSMRAVSYDSFAIPIMGIPVNRIIVFTFAIGSSLAAIAGILFGMSYPVMTPYMGSIIGWKAFIAAVIGGIGDIKGAFIGGFLLGFIEIFITAVFPSSFKDLVSFLILLVIMVVKPTGFFGVPRRTKI